MCAKILTVGISALITLLTTLTVCADTNAATSLRVPADYKTIQAAIDAANLGDTVLVSAGTYAERIQLKDGVHLRSAGDDTAGKIGMKRAEATIIDGGGENGKIAGVTMAQGSSIDGFTVTGVGSYSDKRWNKHHATQGELQSHEPIGQTGIAGIAVIGVTCTVKNNLVHHIGYSGIAIQGLEGRQCSPHVYRNTCYRNMGGGIGSMQKSTAIIEENSCFQNFYAGIGHDDASPSVINNLCFENIRAGIGISEGACPVVRGNKCYRNRRAGIGTRTGGLTRPIIEDNQCYENDMAGIGTSEQASPVIRNNRCYKNRLAGIGSQTHATPTIIGNECYENLKSGIGQQSGAVTVLVGNHVHHNKASGIGFQTTNEGRSTVVDNRIIDNAAVAIGIHTGWTVYLSGNQLSRQTGMPPIAMVFEGADATFTGNVIRGGGVAGIRVAGKVRIDHNEFAGTSLRKVGPPNFAVWALPGSDVTMIANKIHHWRHGLHATKARVVVTANTVSHFHGTAFSIQKPVHPANVYGNKAISSNPKDKILSISGETGVVSDNQMLTEPNATPY